MLTRVSLADADPDAADGPCATCSRRFPAWALYRTGDGLACGECLLAAAPPPPPALPDPSWEGEAGKLLKAQRDIEISGTLWAVASTSPLSAASRAAFAAYHDALHRMTVDYAPEDWAWPERPALTYEGD